MAVMVFKRSVFETRRKPKAAVKPKQQASVKEVAQVYVRHNKHAFLFTTVTMALEDLYRNEYSIITCNLLT